MMYFYVYKNVMIHIELILIHFFKFMIGKNPNFLVYFFPMNHTLTYLQFVCLHSLRRGKITKAKFCSALDLCLGVRLHLSWPEMEALCKKYDIDGEFVNYKKFIMDIKLKDGNILERNPKKQVSNLNHRVFSEYDNKNVDRDELDNILYLISLRVRERRNNVKPLFTPYDPRNFGTVTQTQFQSILKTLGILPDSKKDREVLLAAFTKPNTKNVSYKLFCKRVDPVVSSGLI